MRPEGSSPRRALERGWDLVTESPTQLDPTPNAFGVGLAGVCPN